MKSAVWVNICIHLYAKKVATYGARFKTDPQGMLAFFFLPPPWLLLGFSQGGGKKPRWQLLKHAQRPAFSSHSPNLLAFECWAHAKPTFMFWAPTFFCQEWLGSLSLNEIVCISNWPKFVFLVLGERDFPLYLVFSLKGASGEKKQKIFLNRADRVFFKSLYFKGPTRDWNILQNAG